MDERVCTGEDAEISGIFRASEEIFVAWRPLRNIHDRRQFNLNPLEQGRVEPQNPTGMIVSPSPVSRGVFPARKVQVARWLAALLLGAVAWTARAQTAATASPTPPLGSAVTVASNDVEALRAEVEKLTSSAKPMAALPLARRVLEILEARPGGTQSLETATALTEVASLCRRLTKLPEALSLAQRSLVIREKIAGPKSLETARGLASLAKVKQSTMDNQDALSLAQRARDILDGTPGAGPKDYAAVMDALGGASYALGKFADAETYDLKSVEYLEKAYGPDPLPAAALWSNLSQAYLMMGNADKASTAIRRGVDIQQKTLGPDNTGLAQPLAALGSFYAFVGDFVNSEAAFARSVDLYRKENQGDSRGLALSLSGLGIVRGAMNDFQGALQPSKDAIAMLERVLGPEKADVARKVADLGDIMLGLGDDAEAEKLYRRALDIWKIDPDTTYQEEAYTVGKLGETIAKKGELVEAEKLSRKALATLDKEFGPANADRAVNLRRLALWRTWQGAPEEGAEFARKAQASQDAMLNGILSFATQQQRLEFQRVNESWSLLATLGLAAPLADTVLRYKGVVLDSLLEDRLTAAASADPAIRGRIEEARTLQRDLTALRTDAPDDSSPEGLKARDAKLAETAGKLEKLEGDMARAVGGVGRARRSLGVTAAQVGAALPAGAALVEFVRYNHSLQGKAPETRYGAVILRTGSAPAWVALGDAKPIEAGLAAYRDGVRENGDDLALEEALGTLGRLVWEPVGKALPADTRDVIVSPDGELNFLSFATLLTGKGEFLGERYRVAYVGSGRDLVGAGNGALAGAPDAAGGKGAGKSGKEKGGKTDRGTMLVFANPRMDNAEPPGGLKLPEGTALASRSPNRAAFRDARFAPLPGAEVEGRDLVDRARKWGWKPELFTGADATEARLATVHSPRVLHLATHGFFLPPPAEGKGGKDDSSAVAARLNAMDRSGLALAGAASTLAAWGRGEIPRTSDDGIVTAEEVSALDLRNTWLVTLSACESGGGEARSGEGVLGLRRGFALAGARNLLLTLWPVPDKETTALMLDFYAAAEKTDDPARALAETQRELLVKLRREQGVAPAVRLAGAFILSSRGR